ncbi:hypothetical protein ACQP2P_11435 [Dactylosporangium sp. CA-139114]|uniref:hypothetical protein n=1 Tax=Dactylosporangium sp. CA-139114 TaxID=3239931 RepID=UPI003D95B2C0
MLDYEVDFPAASPLELALYSGGAVLFPRVVLGETAIWGTLRRPGVLDIPQAEYERVLDEFAARCLDVAFVRDLFATLRQLCARLETATGRLNALSASRVDIDLAVNALVELMALHVLNWALPMDRLEAEVGGVVGASAARTLIMRLLVPVTSAHLADFAALTASAARAIGDERWSSRAATDLAHAIGHLQRPGLAERPFESAGNLEMYIRSLHADDVAHLEAMRDARVRSERSLARDVSRLYLAVHDRRALGPVIAATLICRLAAEEEEQRRRWQSATLSAIRVAADRLALDLATVLPWIHAGAPVPGAVTRPRLLDMSDGAWAWTRS